MKGKISLILLVLMLIFPVFSREMSKAEKIAYLAKPAVVRVITQVVGIVSYKDNNGQQAQEKTGTGGLGSGFIINPDGYVLTAGHVVALYYRYQHEKDKVQQELLKRFVIKKMKEENLQLNMENFQRWIQRHQPHIVKMQANHVVFLTNYKTFVYEIKKYSPFVMEGGKDVAVLKIERDNCPVLFLGDSSTLVVGQDVWAIGYPGSVDIMGELGALDMKSVLIQPTLTKGVLSSVKADFKGLQVLQTDANITHGNSGGPLVDENARAIGIVSFGSITPDPLTGQLKEAVGYNFVIPINTAKEFIRDAGVEYNVASEFTKTYNALLEAYWNGDLFKARDLVAIALSYMRGQPDLQKLQAEILREIQNMPVLKKIWMQHKALVIIGIVVILLIVGILFIALKPSQTAAPTEAVVKQPEAAPVEEKPTVLEPEVAGRVEIFVRGNKISEEVLPPEGAIVGRDPARARIVINEPIVSKVHCKIVPQENDTFLVVDLNSTNGTYVGGKKISQEVVRAGDSIQLGKKGDVVLIVKK